jgi:hypothetical protein
MTKVAESYRPHPIATTFDKMRAELEGAGVTVTETKASIGFGGDPGTPNIPAWHLSYDDADATAVAKIAEMKKATLLR